MADIGSLVERLIEAGVPPALAAQAVAEAYAAGAASAPFRGEVDTRSKAAIKQQRYRDRNASVTKGNGNVTRVTWDYGNEMVTNRNEMVTNRNDVTDANNKEVSKKDISRGTRLLPEWAPSPDDKLFALNRGWSITQIDNEAANFRDYWIARPGSGGVKRDWSATWRNWIRNSKVKPAGNRPHLVVSDKITAEQAVEGFARFQRLPRGSPFNDISQAPPDLLAKYGLLSDGRKIASQGQT